MRFDRDDDLKVAFETIPAKGQFIGRGSFGYVYKANYKGTEVAIKELATEAVGVRTETAELEIQALRYVEHFSVSYYLTSLHVPDSFIIPI